MSSEMQRAIEAERARCLSLVEAYRDKYDGYASMLVTRLSNIIRNGIVPESFEDQLASREATEYLEPESVEAERERCLDCLRLHYDDDAPIEVREMLLDLEAKIAGPS